MYGKFKKKFWFTTGGIVTVGAVIAALSSPLGVQAIPAEHLLKAPKEDIVHSQIVTEFLEDKTSREDAVYYFVTDKKAKINPDEIKRTPNTVIRKLDEWKEGDTTYTKKFGYFYGAPRFELKNGEWHDVKSATTTPEAFQLQTRATFGEKTLSYLGSVVHAQTSTTTTNLLVAGEIWNQVISVSYETVRNGQTGSCCATASSTAGPVFTWEDGSGFGIVRVFYNYDLLSEIDPTDTVSSSTIHTVVESKDGNSDGITIAMATSSLTAIALAQFGNISLASTTATDYVGYDDHPATGVIGYQLNATGLSWIEEAIDNSDQVRFVQRTSLDIQNTAPSAASTNRVDVNTSSGDNALLVEWTEAVTNTSGSSMLQSMPF